MTDDEQDTICKVIAASCMWGFGGIGSVILDKLQARLPQARDWRKVHEALQQSAKYEAVGVVKSEAEIDRYLKDGFTLCNYAPGELSIFYPRTLGGGLCKYIVGDLADKYGVMHDPWNFRAHKLRAAAAAASGAAP